MSDDKQLALCMPTYVTVQVEIPGSVVVYCDICSTPIYASPSTQAEMRRGLPLVPVCIPCGYEHLKQQPEEKRRFARLTDEQKAEIGPEATRTVEAYNGAEILEKMALYCDVFKPEGH